jgi:ribosomal protein S18 acetylase RimI-like enzyme
MAVYFRKLLSDEVWLHREIRLRALSEASQFLGESFAFAAAQPPHYWKELTTSFTDGKSGVMILAMDGSHPVGSIYGRISTRGNQTGHISGLWVDPTVRGKGVGRELVQSILDWSIEMGLEYLDLWVPEHSDPANRLYSKSGFRRTGKVLQLPTSSILKIFEMRVAL